MTARPGPPAWASGLGAFVLYLALAVAVFASAWVDPAHRWIGEAKDPRLFIWYLGYVPPHLVHPDPLFTTALNAPYGVNLMWNTSVIAPAVLLSPVTARFGPVVAYNALVTLGVAGSAWAAFVAARFFVTRLPLRFLAGFVYGFSPAVMAQATRHAHVVVAVLPPLVLLLVYEAVVRRRNPVVVGIAIGALATLQLLTGEEMLALTALAGALGVAFGAVVARAEIAARFKPLLVTGAASLATFAVLAGFPLFAQFAGRQRAFGRLQPPDVYVNDLLAFVVPNAVALQNHVSRAIVSGFTGNPSEDNAYVGLPLLILFLFAVISRRRDPLVVWAALLTGGLALLSLGPHLHVAGTTTAIPLPWLVLAHLPLFESADADRAMLLGFLPLALVVARWADSAWPARRAALVAVLLFAVAAVLPPVPFVSTAVEVPAFFQAGGGVERLPRDAIVLVTPFSSKESSEAMLWQATAGYRFRMPEGDAFTPGPTLGPKPSFLRSTLEGLDAGTVAASPSPEARDRMLAELHELGVTAVVAGPSPGSDRIVAYLITVLGEPPESREGVRVWWRCCPAPG